MTALFDPAFVEVKAVDVEGDRREASVSAFEVANWRKRYAKHPAPFVC